MSFLQNHPRYLVVLVFLVVAGCGGGDVSLTPDLSAARDLSPNGTCPATVSLEHICNTLGGSYCLYRDTQLNCVADCDPVGCVGTDSGPFNGDGGARGFICVTSCDDCKPTNGASCFTE